MLRMVGLGLLLSSSVFALSTGYATFDHPEGWRCERVEGIWICQNQTDPERKESIVMSIATKKTEWDSLENFEKYLKTPRPIVDEEGKTVTPEVTYTRKRTINGHAWMDSLQKNSELSGFWTRYLATITPDFAILITYVVSEERYYQMAPKFERMVGSLRVTKELNLNIPSRQGDGPMPGSEKLGPTKDILRDRLNVKKKTTPPPAADNTTIILMGGALVVVLVYLMLKRRKRKNQRSSNPDRRAS